MFKIIRLVRNDLDRDAWMAFHDLEHVNTEEIRKIAEYVFGCSTNRVAIYDIGMWEKNRKKLKERKSYALIVEHGDKGYKEILQKVKMRSKT